MACAAGTVDDGWNRIVTLQTGHAPIVRNAFRRASPPSSFTVRAVPSRSLYYFL
ncbi:hypothetical protein BN2476_640098 [Paraburkholderia piptadeniae]|uniref:Uncharacterized protein n=1 Tax=Paraburkholderia piptadeniae TaxID=1701573 RepID=A0A1N7SMC6_9BURK|nr:hypothetical protein BN2476_640098 [Paraburkholderia piptadeniae]